MESIDLARYFADFLNNYGAKDTDILEAKNGKVFSYMVVCTAQDKASAQNILIDFLAYAKNELGQINCGIEGYKKAEWIVCDYGKVFVHIFQPEAREKFNIEKLWK